MAVKRKDNSNEKLVINQIIVKAPTRKSYDVGMWRTALQSADKDKVKTLYELFDDLLIDGVLADAVDKRISAVTNAALTFQDEGGMDIPEITDLIGTSAFEQLLETIMYARFWGRSGGEFDFSVENGFLFSEIDPKHINLANHQILINDTDETGIDYTADDHLLVLGKRSNFGLFLKTAPLVIWKRGGFGDYAQWLELFGMPQRIGKYSSYDTESRVALEAALENAGSAPWVVVPKETDIEQTNLIGNSTGSAHADFIKQCNTEILITILGQTMTTLDGSSRSQSETHKEVEEGKNRNDIRFVCRVLNSQVLPLLEARGFPVSGGKFVFPQDSEPITVEDIVKLCDIIEIPANYIHEKYGIPVPDGSEAIARRSGTGAAPASPSAKEGNDAVEAADRTWWKNLWDFFASAPGSGATSEYPISLNEDSLTARIIKAAADGSNFMPELFDFISRDLITALDAKPVRLADLGFTYNFQNDAFRTAQELNIFHFSAAKTVAELQTLNELYRKSKSFGEFYKMASEKVDVFNKTWQRTEWQSATLVSESAASYNRLNGKTDIFPFWRYTAVMDGKTRPEHEALHGTILPANDPRWNNIYPPNGWKCRCYVVPRMRHEVEGIDMENNRKAVDEYMNTSDWDNAVKSGFGVNRALTPNVFSENQMYLHKFPTMASKLLKNVTYQTYKLGSYEANRKKATTAASLYKGTIDDYVAGLKQQDGKSFFSDYNNRLIEFNLKRWLKGHKNSINERMPYLKSVSETLSTPDEVWINGVKSDSFDQYVFVKYYSDIAMLVVTKINNGTLYEVITWFNATEKGELKYNYRHGLLIKKPGT